MRVNYIRNAFALGMFITFVYIIFLFLRGNSVEERIQGTWSAVCIQDEIIFTGNAFIRGRETGEFRIMANLIYFNLEDSGYPIKVTEHYMVINEIYYLRVKN